MRKLANCLAGGAVSVALVLCAHAQSEQATQAEPATQVAPATSVEPVAQSAQAASQINAEQSTKFEPEAKVEPSASSKAESKVEPSTQAAPSIDEFVAKLDSATRAIHQNSKNDAALVQEGCRKLLNEVLDLDAMTQAANGDFWERMTPPQRETFRAAFEHRMIASCVRQFVTYAGEKLHLAGVRTTDGENLLATVRVGSQDDAKLVTWQLHKFGPHNWRAVDVIAEGRSAVLDAQNEFAAVLQGVNGDIEALITFMQK